MTDWHVPEQAIEPENKRSAVRDNSVVADGRDESAQVRRDGLVAELKQNGAVRDPKVERAFRNVPRHRFLPEVAIDEVYRDRAHLIKQDDQGRPVSSSSQPAIMATMLQQLDLRAGQRVLEIGAGSGYNAALISHLVGPTGQITSIDIDSGLVDTARARLDEVHVSNVQLVCGDGAFGDPAGAPYDRIIVTVGAPDIFPAWTDQLASDGRLVLPISLRGAQRSVAFDRADGLLTSDSVRDCGFMRLRGPMAGPQTLTPLGPRADIFCNCDDGRAIDADGLYEALNDPGIERVGRVQISVGEALGGLGLWLALCEPDIARLSATGAAAEAQTIPGLASFGGQTLTVAILGERALAGLQRPADAPESFPVTVRGHGADSDQLAARLIEHARRWEQAGRPSTSDLHISAYPAGSGIDAEGTIIDNHHSRLALAWS